MNWKCYFDVSALCLQVAVAFLSKAEMLHNYLGCNMFLSNKALTPALQCQHYTSLDFPCCSGSEERNSSAVDNQCVKKFLTAQGVQGRRRPKQEEELKCLLFSPLQREFYYDGGYFFFTLAWRDRGLALPSNTHSHSISLHPLCMSVCMCVCEKGSQWAWVGNGVYVWVTLQACKPVLVCNTSCSACLFPSIHPSIHPASVW